jgi:hypothetical protein
MNARHHCACCGRVFRPRRTGETFCSWACEAKVLPVSRLVQFRLDYAEEAGVTAHA